MTFRAFVGLPIGPVPDLVEVLRELDATGADVKTVRPEQLHLTLDFLGDVPDEAAAPLARALDLATRGTPALTLRLHGVGAFPDARKPRVVWAGIRAPDDVAALALRVRDACRAAGHAGDAKPFRAHVTLARTKSAKGLPRLAAYLREHAERALPEVAVTEARVYKSTLGPGGSRHEVLHRAPLEA